MNFFGFFADIVLHKLSADITAPWKAGRVTEIASVWGLFKFNLFFCSHSHCSKSLGWLSRPCLSLSSNDSDCFPSSLSLFVWPWWAADWKPFSSVLAFLQTAGICGVERQGGREAPPGKVTYWFDSVSLALLRLSIPGCIKSRMNAAAANIARAINQ